MPNRPLLVELPHQGVSIDQVLPDVVVLPVLRLHQPQCELCPSVPIEGRHVEVQLAGANAHHLHPVHQLKVGLDRELALVEGLLSCLTPTLPLLTLKR